MLKPTNLFILVVTYSLLLSGQLFANGYDECQVPLIWTPDSKWVIFDDGVSMYKTENDYLKQIDDDLKKKIDELINQLGNDEWEIREKATQELEGIGKPLLPLLKEVDTKNPEIKMRIKKIKETIESAKHNWVLLLKDGMEPDLAPDGKTIVCRTKNQLMVTDIEGKNPQVIAEGEFYLPRWVDNGKNIIFSRGERFYGMDLYIIDAAGKNLKQITNTKSSELNAHPSPDGKTIVYQYQGGSGEKQARYEILFQMDLDKLSSTQLVSYKSSEAHYDHPKWFRDGKEIYYQYGGWGEWDIYRLKIDQPDVSEKKAVKIISDGYHAHLSPDEKKIIFARPKIPKGNTPRWEMDADIWLADIDGKNEKQLTSSEKDEISPAFSSDGKFVVYRTLDKVEGEHTESITIIPLLK